MLNKNLNSRYHIIKYIANGGFGATYLAEDRMLPGHPKCLVKQLQPVERDVNSLKEARRLFQKEAEILQKLGTNDRIPQLLAYFEEEREFFIVQQFIEGHTLFEELVPEQRWSENKAIEFLKDCLEILRFVHAHNVIHRDIKPDNIIRRACDNKLVLVDFGAVKEILGTHSKINQGRTVAVGTLCYMPIEQALGQPRLNSDIYSLGTIVIQAISGMSPLELQIDLQFPREEEKSWHDRARVNPRLIEIMDKMVHCDFKQRYQSAEEILNDLQEFESLSESARAELHLLNLVSHSQKDTLEVRGPLRNALPDPSNLDSELELVATEPFITQASKHRLKPNTLMGMMLAFGAMFFGGTAFWITQRPVLTQLAALDEIEDRYYNSKKYRECSQKLESINYLEHEEILTKRDKLLTDCSWKTALNLASSQQYSEAIETLENLILKSPADFANPQVIKEKIDEWSQNILEIATELYKKKPENLDVAVKMIETIPEDSSVKQQAMAKVGQWMAEEKQREEKAEAAKRAIIAAKTPQPAARPQRTVSNSRVARQQQPKQVTATRRNVSTPQAARPRQQKPIATTRRSVSTPQVARQQPPRQEVVNLCQNASALGNCN